MRTLERSLGWSLGDLPKKEGYGRAIMAILLVLVVVLAFVVVGQQMELNSLRSRTPSQQSPQNQMPPYVLEFGTPSASGYANPSELDDFAKQMGGPGSPLMPYAGLVVAWGEGADGYYWIWINNTRSGEFYSNSSQVAEIENVIEGSAKSWGYPDLIPLKMAVGTGLGGYD